MSIYRKSVILQRNETYFFCEEQTLYGSARLGTEQVEHSMRGLVTKDGLTDAITRAREQHGDDWQQRLQEQYEGNFYERLQDAWGNEWSTRLDLLLQGNNDTWLVEQIRNESYTLQAGNKRFELSNHLGNVLAVVSDKKVQADGVVWQAEVVSAQDYFPFGMAMPGRSSGSYRYGVTGKERDNEIETYDFGARFYQSNLGRWLSPDPLESKYPAWSTYNYVMNCPLTLIDPTGMGVDWKPEVEATDKDEKKEAHVTLVKEENDDHTTLAKFLKIDESRAKELMKAEKDGKIALVNERLDPKTRKMVNFAGDLVGKINDLLTKSINDPQFDRQYNCHAASLYISGALAAAEAENKFPIWYNPDILKAGAQLSDDVGDTPEKWQFGRSFMRFRANPVKKSFWDKEVTVETPHSAIYLGTDVNGTVWVFTKNGNQAPKITTLQALESSYDAHIEGYGARKDPKVPSGGGVFNVKQ